jgi:hypothetical protein
VPQLHRPLNQAFNPDFPLGREAMSRRFGMQFSRRFYRRIGDTAIQNGVKNAPKATDSARDPYWKIWVQCMLSQVATAIDEKEAPGAHRETGKFPEMLS